MDSAIGAAARALSQGDPLYALKFVALRTDPPALALRGIALAQLGELNAARGLLRRAAKAFERAEPAAHARCIVAAAEVALAQRDLVAAARGVDTAIEVLSARQDADNALYARLLLVRRATLLGDVSGAHAALKALALERAPTRLVAVAALCAVDLASKRLESKEAEQALKSARAAALAAGIPQLLAEVDRAERQFHAPVARLICGNEARSVTLGELEHALRQPDLIVDTCARQIRCGALRVNLVRRAVLLALAAVLAERSPAGVTREELVVRVFGARRMTDSHRVRLRVEVGRLRQQLRGVAELRATEEGFALLPSLAVKVVVLAPPGESEASALLALLQGGQPWATSALAEALGKSQRAVQRALAELEREGKVQAHGKGPAQRWVCAPSPEIATALLLVAPGTLG